VARIVAPTLDWPLRLLLEWANGLARRHISGSFTWNPASINATTTADTTLSDLSTYPALKGLRAGHPITVTPPSDLNAGLIIGAAWVGTDDTLTIRLRNVSASPVDQGSGTWQFFQLLI